MAIYRRKVNVRKVWWVRVNHKGLKASRVCASKGDAKLAESDLLQRLKRRAGQAEQHGEMPATIKALFDAYVADLEARGKGPAVTDQTLRAATEAVSGGQIASLDIIAQRLGACVQARVSR